MASCAMHQSIPINPVFNLTEAFAVYIEPKILKKSLVTRLAETSRDNKNYPTLSLSVHTTNHISAIPREER